MEKITSIRKGRIWVNVYKDQDGDMAITIQKTFRGRDGGWKPTPFLRPKFGDIESLMEALGQFVDAHYGHSHDIHREVEMKGGQPSFKIHCLVEYMKSRGFPLESGEVAELGPELVMADYFDLELALSPVEADLLQAEMMELARQTEMVEAQRKMHELFPEDCGEVHFRQASHERGQRATTYSLPFSYPVDANLRGLGPGAFPPLRRKPLEAKYEVMHMKENEMLETEKRGKALEAYLAGSANISGNGPRMLPVIDINGKRYFVDERLKQLRSVVDPSDYIDF